MDCPNCDKRPVKRFYTFSLNGVKFKNYLRGYFKCMHCGTLLKQATGSGSVWDSVASYEEGFWKWFVLFMLLNLGVMLGFFALTEETEISIWITFPLFFVFLTGLLVAMNELKVKYWILEEVDDVEKDQKKQRSMGTLGWTLLLGFFILMLGGGITFDQYINLSGFSEWQYIVGMLVYLIAIVAGSLGIFNYFSESGDGQAIVQE